MIRGRVEARWLPSRHRFALFRLHAYLRLKRATPRVDPSVMLMVHPDQTAFDTYAVSWWTLATMACFAGFLLAKVLIAPVAALLAVPLGSLAIQLPIIVFGALVRSARNVGLNSKIGMGSLLLLSLYFARSASWVRFAAWQFLAIVALNALAAIVLFALRGDVARMESAYGGASSAE